MAKLVARLLLKAEQAKYRQLMERWHYLGPLTSSLGTALQYVVEDHTGEWFALLDFGYASLKNASRDDWLGWSRAQKEKRLRYVVTNTRFLVLPAAKRSHCAPSQALSLVLRRLKGDWAQYHGHPVLLVETFIDPSRFQGTCYRAANWLRIGETKGFGRDSDHYFEHGAKKDVYVYQLHRYARKILSSSGFAHPFLTAEQPREPTMVDINQLPLEGDDGLLAALECIRDKRKTRGQRYSLRSLLALVVCGMLSGCDSFQAFYEFGQNLSHEARKRLGFRPFNMPTEKVFRYTLNNIDAAAFDKLVSQWVLRRTPKLRGRVLAVDGKTMRASRTNSGKAPHLLSAVLHNDGLVVAQHQVPDKTNEIIEVKDLLDPLPIEGATVTFDAMHTQLATAHYLNERRADYVMTVKDNRKDLVRLIESLPEEAFSPSADTPRQGARTNRKQNHSGGKSPRQLQFPFC